MKIDWSKFSFQNLLIILLIVISGFFLIKWNISQHETKKVQDEYAKEILQYDSVKIVSDGIWSKYVAQTKEVSVLRNLKDSIPELWRIIKDNNEKVKLQSYVNLTLQSKVDSLQKVGIVYITEKDSIFPRIDFASYYPNPGYAFITFKGTIYKGLLNDSWEFGNLSLGLTVTETQPGIWKSYLSGPDWITINDLQVQSTIKEKKDPFLKIYVGAGYFRSFDNKQGPLVAMGFDIKRRLLLTAGVSTQFAYGSLLYGF